MRFATKDKIVRDPESIQVRGSKRAGVRFKLMRSIVIVDFTRLK
jgi:hypothetical protein